MRSSELDSSAFGGSSASHRINEENEESKRLSETDDEIIDDLEGSRGVESNDLSSESDDDSDDDDILIKPKDLIVSEKICANLWHLFDSFDRKIMKESG